MQAFNFLRNRGLIYQSSQLVEETLKALLPAQSIYLGVDPTAKGLHIGHLMAFRTLKRFHDSGVKSIALIGGATALIGDPSFKVKERDILSFEDVQTNIAEIKKDVERVLECSGDENLLFVNNYDWYKDMNAIDFLREIGKNMRMQSMLAKDSVNKRINSENSMSFAEFSYQCLQSCDFLHLHKEYNCVCQIGGSDQWGNITSGIDLVKRVTNHTVHGITVPLLTNSHGQKFGKSEGNAIWINKARTSNHDYYQFFLRVEDADLPLLLRTLTDLPEDAMTELLNEHIKQPEKREAQEVLAAEIMRSTRSEQDLQKAKKCAEVLFGKENITKEFIEDVIDELPLTRVPKAKEWTVVDLIVSVGLADSKKAGKRVVSSGGVRVNGRVVKQPNYVIGDADMIDSCIVPLQVGKKQRKFVMLEFVVCYRVTCIVP